MKENKFIYTSDLPQKCFYFIGDKSAFYLSSERFITKPVKGDVIEYLSDGVGGIYDLKVNGNPVK